MPALTDSISAPLPLPSTPLAALPGTQSQGTQPASADPLANLRDIHLPADVSTLPLAPGWWILATLILIALVGGYLGWRRHRQAQRYRRAALELLQQIDLNGENTQQSLQAINAILKRAALVAYPHTHIAGLYGPAWSHFLQQSAPDLRQPDEVSGLLHTGLYAAPATHADSLRVLHDYARDWLKKHAKEAKLALTELHPNNQAPAGVIASGSQTRLPASNSQRAADAPS